jgi:hypothetical protein
MEIVITLAVGIWLGTYLKKHWNDPNNALNIKNKKQ